MLRVKEKKVYLALREPAATVRPPGGSFFFFSQYFFCEKEWFSAFPSSTSPTSSVREKIKKAMPTVLSIHFTVRRIKKSNLYFINNALSVTKSVDFARASSLSSVSLRDISTERQSRSACAARRLESSSDGRRKGSSVSCVERGALLI